MRNRQVGPSESAAILANVVSEVAYKPNWRFELSELNRGQGCEGLTLVISFTGPNSLNPDEETEGVHLMPVLPAAYNREAWIGWVFEQIRLVEKHESAEFFAVGDERPFFADHGPGRSPYEVMRIKRPEQIEEEAEPWFGGPATDEHFEDGQP